MLKRCMMHMCTAGMGMSQTNAVAGSRRPVVKGNMGVDDIDLDDDDVRSLNLLCISNFLPDCRFFYFCTSLPSVHQEENPARKK